MAIQWIIVPEKKEGADFWRNLITWNKSYDIMWSEKSGI